MGDGYLLYTSWSWLYVLSGNYRHIQPIYCGLVSFLTLCPLNGSESAWKGLLRDMENQRLTISTRAASSLVRFLRPYSTVSVINSAWMERVDG